MPQMRRQRWLDAGRLALWAAVLMPLTILLHELGHFMFAAASGLPAQLHPTHVSGGAVLGAAPRWLVALQAGGGPAASVLMVLAGVYLFRRWRRPAWAIAFVVGAASRFVVTSGYLAIRLFLFVLGRPFGGHPNFDEYNLAQALRIAPEITALAATAILAAVIVWALRRLPRGGRFTGALGLAAGVLAGAWAWITLMPPVLLTAP